MRLLPCLLMFFVFANVTVAQETSTAAKSAAVKGPLSPEESLKHLVLADPNLQIEIVAAEPEVIDPVAIQFDEHGRLWVVEMRDYPTGPQNAPPPLGGPDAKPLSRIKLLEDKDGNGRYETAHVFADNLLFATGVQPWDGGVIVTHSGEIVYLKDTDGDHKADLREVWFTGFSETNTQLRANHPTFGPDGWIYVANGLRGGNVIAVKKDWPVKVEGETRRQGDKEKNKAESSSSPSPLVSVSPRPTQQGVSHDPANPQPVSLTGRDFKFDPLTGRYEAISGNGQFGMTFDAWGNRFVCDNRHPCRHVIFEEDFIKRCPHVAFPAVVHDVIPADDKNQVFPLTSAWTTSNLHAGTFTASCGVTVYTGDWLPEEFRGNVFVCEPTGNLVQRAILEPDGVTFKSRNPYQRSSVAPQPRFPNASPTPKNNPESNGQATSLEESRSWNDRATGTQEFLASRDDWFRPVDLQNGPDGALYVVDMYRAVIEHPEWVPDELKKRPDTWLGNDKGRIYRIRPSSPVAPRQEQPNARATSEKQSASTARSADLSRSDRATLGKPIVSVANLDASFNSTNGWHRTTASRVLHERVSRNELLPIVEPRRDEAWNQAVRAKQLRRFVGGAETFRLWYSPNEHLRAAVVGLLRELTEDEATRGMIKSQLKHFLTDQSPLVRMAAIQAFYLGPITPDQQVAPNADVEVDFAFQAIEDSADAWIRQAVVAVASDEPFGVFEIVLENPAKSLPAREVQRVLLALLGEQVGIRYGRMKDAEDRDIYISTMMATIADSVTLAHFSFPNAVEAALGFERGLSRSGQLVSKSDALFGNRDSSEGESLGKAALKHLWYEPDASKLEESILAARLLKLASPQDEEVFRKLKLVAESPANDQRLRMAAIESLSSFQLPEVTSWLVERYRSETPAIRRAILAALFASKERQLRLLEAIEQGQIAATELDPVRVNQLTQAKDETLRERAKTVLAAAAPASRHEVLDAYRPALALTADPKRGREVFVKNCSTCHRVDNVGVNVAPDISDTRTKKPEQLLLDILDPNKAIDANYFAYAVVTKEGKTESGVISSETATSITLKQPEGKVLTLLRTDIDELRNTGLSLMPVGVEKNIDQQAMADLIFWLKNWRYLDGKVPATSLK